jgi:hypothetical protein
MRRAVAAAAIAVLQPVGAAAEERVRIDYVLPAVTLAAGVSQRLTHCLASPEEQSTLVGVEPDDERLRIGFAYKVAITGKQSLRRLVRLDAETGFLSSVRPRSTSRTTSISRTSTARPRSRAVRCWYR